MSSVSGKANQGKAFVDTDILIDYTKKKSRILEKLLEMQARGETVLFINPVVVAEFLTDQNLTKQTQIEEVQVFLSLFTTVEITKKMGVLAGQMLREKTLPFLGDALIAATCIEKQFKLVTRNRRHFTSVPDLNFW